MDRVKILRKIIRILLIVFSIFGLFCALLAFSIGDHSLVNIFIFAALAFFLVVLLFHKRKKPKQSYPVAATRNMPSKISDKDTTIACSNPAPDKPLEPQTNTTLQLSPVPSESESAPAKPSEQKEVAEHNEPKNTIEGLDPLFVDSGKYVIEKNKASIGMLQRLFKIGFNRAALIINELSAAGVVGPERGTEPREILLTLEEFYALIEMLKISPTEPQKRPEKPDTQKENEISKSQISERLSWYNNKFDYMEGHDFEEYCAALLRNIGYRNVEVTKGSNDNGIDILATLGGVKYGIQCKCYSSDIGIKAIQEAFAGARFYNCHVPVVLTNRYFTRQAKEMARKTNVLMWDRTVLSYMVEASERKKESSTQND